MMKKLISTAALLFSLDLFAEELHHSELATHSGIYVEPKIVVTLGERVSHGTAVIEGDMGYGIGFDLGYSFNEYFALELDGTYSVADVTLKHPGQPHETDQAEFYSYGVNSVFTYPLHHHFILLGKLGYGYEHEDLGELGISGKEHGAMWAAGLEYSFSPHVEVSLEYEGADIRSARGHNIQMGLIYKF